MSAVFGPLPDFVWKSLIEKSTFCEEAKARVGNFETLVRTCFPFLAVSVGWTRKEIFQLMLYTIFLGPEGKIGDRQFDQIVSAIWLRSNGWRFDRRCILNLFFATLIMPHSNASVPHYCRSYPFEQVWNEDKMETAFFRSDANGLWGVLGATDIGEWSMKIYFTFLIP